jgi:hypothetical protein
MAIMDDIHLVSKVVRENRTWLAYSEIDLLHDFEEQALTGWCLTAHQRAMINSLVQSANDRKMMAVSLNESGPRMVS